MNFINESILEYSLKNSSEESELLKKLRKETNQKILHPRMLSGKLQGRLLSLISKLINRKTSLIYARKEKVYLSILLLSLLKYLFKWKPLFYYVEYVKFIQPKICISFIDNSSVFFSLKSFCPEIIFIVIQNGTRSYHNDLSRLLFLKKDNKYSVDYGFYFGKYIKNYVSKIIKINITR